MTSTAPSARAAGLLLVAFPLLVQVPFGLLAARFDYPDVLLLGAAEVLPRFHALGPGLVLTWWAFALCTVGLLAAVALLPGALGASGGLARLSLAAGAGSALLQLAGLLRWVLVVPWLAATWEADPALRPALSVAYEVQHRLFGVVLGEHAGQLLLALWTLAAAVMVHRVVRSRWLLAGGVLAAALFLAGLGAGLARSIPALSVLGPLPLAAFLVWSAWAVATGVVLVVRSLPGLRAREAGAGVPA